ncbi:LpqB family beta-propeller domain-containing protein [Nocardioides daeguensis]|uniref:MtrAB system accessory lipoprotein LpqB n=1 Tax=Nocardioides daeguensis TaxID=908359 RepID=A0ABP6WIP1_9ACTN|nr:LpqB family beta-propeller domain-containing protein [Nocardioides daeguensis]MBV6729039.1 GerMN domain-containing protein [Nocardioides daeguensis]MCR1774957.1 GerMN domain-containing protein [Nocardioides daeguensis]
MTRSRVLPALALVLAVLAGCTSLPTSGPVVQSRGTDRGDTRRASDIDARPPVDGASRTEVVAGFLDAMTAWPVQTSVAKQYLTDEAAAGWNPEQETVIYSDSLPVRESAGTVSVQLTAADRLDAVGAWRGAMATDELTLEFRVAIQDGEYRIVDPPDALVVPASWFRQRYHQVSLYYFDPIAKILVPEPVFVPEGDQLATSLVSGLLAGPPPLAQGVVRSFLPAGLSVGLSVPVSDAGVADIALVGEAQSVTSEQAELMLAQLAWTLRQDPAVTALRVSVDGTALPLPGGVSQYSVDAAAAFGPAGPGGGKTLYGIRQGRLVSGARDADLDPVTGTFGDEGAGVVAVAVRPDNEEAAAVDLGGSRVRLARVQQSAAEPGAAVLLSGGQYARPTWDNAGRLWVLERRPGGAVVWLYDGTGPRAVRVPGITGARARELVVSRDGTRLVGTVRVPGSGDAVVGARVLIGGRGQVRRALRPFVVRGPEGSPITDLAWASPVRVALLTATAPGSLYEADVVAADGATIGVDVLSTIVTGEVLGLAASPVEDAPVYAVYADRFVDLVRQEEQDAGPDGLAQLDYAG